MQRAVVLASDSPLLFDNIFELLTPRSRRRDRGRSFATIPKASFCLPLRKLNALSFVGETKQSPDWLHEGVRICHTPLSGSWYEGELDDRARKTKDSAKGLWPIAEMELKEDRLLINNVNRKKLCLGVIPPALFKSHRLRQMIHYEINLSTNMGYKSRRLRVTIAMGPVRKRVRSQKHPRNNEALKPLSDWG